MCNDPIVGYLKAVGYNVIRLPRRDFKPLQILTRQGKDLVNLGDLTTVLVAGANAQNPVIKVDEPTTTISGKTTNKLSLGVGLSILGSFLGAMGGASSGWKPSTTVPSPSRSSGGYGLTVSRFGDDLDPVAMVFKLLEAAQKSCVVSMATTNC
jgi:hypothetical protein